MASLSTIFRQVEREGARWGLFPVLRDGCVKVCERVAELDEQPGHPAILTHTMRPVLSLNEHSPMDAFSGLLRHRLQRHQYDLAAMAKKRQERDRAALEADIALRKGDIARQHKRRLERQYFTGVRR